MSVRTYVLLYLLHNKLVNFFFKYQLLFETSNLKKIQKNLYLWPDFHLDTFVRPSVVFPVVPRDAVPARLPVRLVETIKV